MTVVLLASRADPASALLADSVARLAPLETAQMSGELELRAGPGFVLAQTERMHLDADGLDATIATALGAELDAILVLSKHRSEAGTPALTVHPIGNWGGEARYGGRPRTLVPPAPRLAAAVLRLLASAPPAGYQVTYEATHHGPLLETPTAYVELGSGPPQWTDAHAARALARAVLDAISAPAPGPVLLGIGGGHYTPRFTDAARRGIATFGHILPSYALADVHEDTLRAAARGHDGFVVDGRGKPDGLDRAVATLRAVLPEKELSV